MSSSRKMPFVVLLMAAVALCSCVKNGGGLVPDEVKMPRTVLMDKIKGGWAGQMAGVTYGAPTEFRYQSVMIPDSVPIAWGDMGYVKRTMEENPFIYDDLYMDLTFVETMERLGVDAPVDSLAMAFAKAGYQLWEANQAARYNILQGIMPPASGHWKNNPHANDIDFQIESDFIGLMCPGMPVAASALCDSVGHIMNYGDGWYGGVYMAAMYSLAFVCDSVPAVVTGALKCIPAESRYHRCISDVVDAYMKNPVDWKAAWELVTDRWGEETGCPTGMLTPYNIDAAINSAYVVIGLLYGNGDFGRTIDIATRCGQDSDCNPASAGGILGTMLGYSNIPGEWLDPVKVAEDIDFAYTSSSLNATYQMSFDHALEMIGRNGGEITDESVVIKCQQPEPVRLEQAFDGFAPLARRWAGVNMVDRNFEDTFTGHALMVTGAVGGGDRGYVAEVEVSVDGTPVDTVLMPASVQSRKLEIYFGYDFDGKEHRLGLRHLNPTADNYVAVHDVLEMTRDTVQ